ncbi:MAG: PLP-dependent aspartate aminotransferase family protein [Bryobacteraceae bacterium]
MKIHTRAVHAGDRKKPPVEIPVTTPVYSAASFISEKTADLDRIFAHELEGYSYARYGTPTAAALEELVTSLEGGHGSLACSSGMSALEIAVLTALAGRPKSVVSADALYGATINLFLRIFEPLGVRVRYVDFCDLAALERVLAEEKPGCLLMETISNPCLRVGAIDHIATLASSCGAALIVDNTFATPLLVRPLELGAHLVVHSLTKYLAGHGDVLGGIVVSDLAHYETMRTLARTYGPLLGAFECYQAMRGIKTFPLRMERQCANAAGIAAWLRQDPRIERVIYPDDPGHPDSATIARLLPAGLRGAMVSFAVKGADRERIFAFMDRLKLVVRATSLGDVHTMMLYPVISSHREMPPAERERLGITENLVRLSAGIEAVEDVLADLDQALG